MGQIRPRARATKPKRSCASALADLGAIVPYVHETSAFRGLQFTPLYGSLTMLS
jgi:hypothetical protein